MASSDKGLQESEAEARNDSEDGIRSPSLEEKFDDVSLGREELIDGRIRRSSSPSLEGGDLSGNDNALDSTVSVESLNLDVPSSYKVETVDFPNSPEELKFACGVAMPIEPARRCSDDEEDRSIYQAQVMSNGEDVRLVKDSEMMARGSDRRKVITVAVDMLSRPDDDLKTDTASSLDGSLDGGRLSPDYPDLDDFPDSPDDFEDSIMSRLGDAGVEPIPELTATEEAQESRAWRTFSLAGVDRQIDLRVLEPYKRVVSHGGYMSQGSRNAIIVFSACFLPDRSRLDYDYVMSNLFMYVISTLDQLVTDDYILVYLHGATQRSSMPKFSWIKQCYQMIDRKLRKNLKGLYLVHPTFWLKTLALMTRPFVSSKFSKKLFFIYSLSELFRKIPLERASIPERVVKYDFDTFGDSSVLET